MAFKVGNRVVITEAWQGMTLVGAKAKVVSIEEGDWYGLDIDGWGGGHRCGVLEGNVRSGWWVPLGCFEKTNVFKGNK